jgi:antitoxin component HigA of HigAB toxin-antitoxin module
VHTITAAGRSIWGTISTIEQIRDAFRLRLSASGKLNVPDNYENEHFSIDPPDPIEAIKIRMEEMNIKQKDLVGIIGPKSKVSEVLNLISASQSLTLTLQVRHRHQRILKLTSLHSIHKINTFTYSID